MDVLHTMDGPKSDSSDTEDFLQDLVSLKDIGLLRATMESLECARLTPLIKEELRCRIQSRRLSEGKEELLVEFSSPTPSQPRPDELDKRDRRREQNRRAAQKFRKKKKERGEHLIEETQRLEYHNTTLRSEIKQLHEEREQLTRIILSHASICSLTPRQSPLTILSDSPTPAAIQESPVAMMSSSNPATAVSPVLGTGCAVTPSSGLTVSPVRDSLVPLVIKSGEEAAVTGPVISGSPGPEPARSRLSPISLLRSPVSVDKSGTKSPTLFGSPPKQSKHSIPPRLSLSGPKSVIPIVPKQTVSTVPSSPAARATKGATTSPLPTTPSPISGTKAVQASPVFWRENGASNHSPLSASSSSSSSTPARIAQQSPVFFGDRAPSSAQASCNFLQPLAHFSVSSASSFASILRQESPLSVLSNSSGISNASSIFTSNNTNFNSCFSNVITQLPGVTSSNDNSNILTSVQSFIDDPQSIYSSSSQSSFQEKGDENVLSLDEIEKSASGFETRDDLLDFMDIQCLLELGTDHNGNSFHGGGYSQSDNTLTCHVTNQYRVDSVCHQEADNGNDAVIATTAILDTPPARVHTQQVCPGAGMFPTSQDTDSGATARLLPQNFNHLAAGDTDLHSDVSGRVQYGSEHSQQHRVPRPLKQQQGDAHGQAPCLDAEHQLYIHSVSSCGQDAPQHRSEFLPGQCSVTVTQLHGLLRDLLQAQTGPPGDDLDPGTMMRNILLSKLGRDLTSGLTNNDPDLNLGGSCSDSDPRIPQGDTPTLDCRLTLSHDDLVPLHTSVPLDTVLSSRAVPDNGPEQAIPQTSQQSN